MPVTLDHHGTADEDQLHERGVLGVIKVKDLSEKAKANLASWGISWEAHHANLMFVAADETD